MSLVTINNLTMAFGGQKVFDGVTARINQGDHVGLVGPNGAGKTTLLRLLLKELEPLGGHIAFSSGVRISYLPQQPEWPPGQTAFQEVYSGLGELQSVESGLRECEAALGNLSDSAGKEAEKLYARYAKLSDRFELLGGSTAEARVSGILDGLGVARRLWASPMDTLSGGERNIVGLAKVLIQDHDLMLLDEPGNHLDFSGLEWLEGFLSSNPKAFIVVSHNRYLLDRVCTRIWELDRCKFEQFGGNYSQYRSEKLTRQLRQEAAFHRAQKEITRLEFNIQRLKSWSSVYNSPKLARTAKTFERRVEALEQIEKPRSDRKRLKFRFLSQPSGSTIALEARKYRKQFEGGFTLLENVDFLVTQGERVAFVGDNGTGKSSLLKDAVSIGSWENPTLRVGKSVTVGYYAQLGENLDEKASLIDEAMRLTGTLRGPASELLHRFLFTRDDLDKSIRVLSGGEKARLQLAVLVRSSATMLLLDEPTNHLDIASREAVEDALEEYPGTLVVVSHDRYFLDKIADRILYFVPPEVRVYDGNFTEFWEKRAASVGDSTKVNHLDLQSRAKFGSSTAKDPAGKKFKPVRSKFDPQRFKQLEEEIAALEALRPQIQEELTKLEDKGKAARAELRRQRLANIDLKLDALYHEWTTLGEKKKKW